MLRRYLVEEGFKVSDAADGAAMRAVLEREAIDLVLLDLMMPGEDGLSLARYIRQRSEFPIIMLTGKGDLIDRVVGLEAGADDYITKPFELREVLARIRTVMRRAARAPRPPHRPRPPPAATRPTRSSSFRAGGSTWSDASSHGRLASSCPSPPASSSCYAPSPAIPIGCSAATSSSTWSKGREWAAYDRAVDTQVGRLRKKLEADPANPTLIKTVRGGGYIFASCRDGRLSGGAAQRPSSSAELRLELVDAVGLAEPARRSSRQSRP